MSKYGQKCNTWDKKPPRSAMNDIWLIKVYVLESLNIQRARCNSQYGKILAKVVFEQ